jgi:hypothetical protein
VLTILLISFMKLAPAGASPSPSDHASKAGPYGRQAPSERSDADNAAEAGPKQAPVPLL